MYIYAPAKETAARNVPTVYGPDWILISTGVKMSKITIFWFNKIQRISCLLSLASQNGLYPTLLVSYCQKIKLYKIKRDMNNNEKWIAKHILHNIKAKNTSTLFTVY